MGETDPVAVAFLNKHAGKKRSDQIADMVPLTASVPWLASPAARFGAVCVGGRRRASIASLIASAATPASLMGAEKREHLVWEAGFAQRFAATLGVLGLASLTLQPHASKVVQRLLHRVTTWSLLGLLSSSCCMLQVVLNFFSFGCAGFNTILGPLRPYFMALTAALQACVWRQTLAGRGAPLRSAMSGTLACAALTFLPELLHVWVHRGQLLGHRRSRRGGAVPEALGLRVSGLGCTACTAKVQAAITAVDGVDACEVALAEGTATVQLGARARAEVEKDVLAAVTAAGFGAVPLATPSATPSA